MSVTRRTTGSFEAGACRRVGALMNGLRVVLFGCPRTSHDGTQWFRQETRQAEALLAYLLLHGPRPHPRDVLAGLFWADSPEGRARNALNTTLWRLRKRLEPAGICRGTYLETGPADEVGLNWRSDLWFDVGAFEGAVGDVVDQQAGSLDDETVLQRVQRALDLYEGELLEGFYEDWILRERERLRSLYFKSLVALMRRALARNEWEYALNLGKRILDKDPVRESIHREVISLHLWMGQRTQALRQYENCVETLRSELDVGPTEETRALYDRIVAERAVPDSTSDALQSRQITALRDLKDALDAASRAVERLKATIHQGRP